MKVIVHMQIARLYFKPIFTGRAYRYLITFSFLQILHIIIKFFIEVMIVLSAIGLR